MLPSVESIQRRYIMDKELYSILDYKSKDIRENIKILGASDLKEQDKQTILKDLPLQVQELLNEINKIKG